MWEGMGHFTLLICLIPKDNHVAKEVLTSDIGAFVWLIVVIMFVMGSQLSSKLLFGEKLKSKIDKCSLFFNKSR